jgi:murein DD-endopeptidase MepM/ murein hydrolase activator NlpD
MQGPYAELAAILTAATPSEFADRLEAIRAVSRSQNRALTDLTQAKADLALASAQAEAARLKAETKRVQAAAAVSRAAAAAARAKAAKARVDGLVRERASALAVAAREKARVKKQYEALKKEQARIRALERGAGGFTGRPTGNLIWPIPGAVVVEVAGPRTHPVYGYKSCHTGIDIRGWYGTRIVSPAAGKVISVVNGGAFGLHTIISHGNGVTTMYAHQSSTAVSVGQIVSQGQTIGYVGSTGWVTGPHLHWEVHVNGVPYDPMGWFGAAKIPVSCWNG